MPAGMKFELKTGVATREAFGKTLVELAPSRADASERAGVRSRIGSDQGG